MLCRLGGAAIFLYRTVQSNHVSPCHSRDFHDSRNMAFEPSVHSRNLDMHFQALSKGDEGSSLVPEQGTAPCETQASAERFSMGCNQIKTQNNQIVRQEGSDPIGEMSGRKTTTQQTAYCIGNVVSPRSGSCQQYHSLSRIVMVCILSWTRGAPPYLLTTDYRVSILVWVCEGRVKSSFAGSSQGRGAISDRP